jgi:hypothetical protein
VVHVSFPGGLARMLCIRNKRESGLRYAVAYNALQYNIFKRMESRRTCTTMFTGCTHVTGMYTQVHTNKYLSRDLQIHGICTEPKARENIYTNTRSY